MGFDLPLMADGFVARVARGVKALFIIYLLPGNTEIKLISKISLVSSEDLESSAEIKVLNFEIIAENIRSVLESKDKEHKPIQL